MAEWNVILSAWIIQDGNYADFCRRQKANFALEFYPHGLQPTLATERRAEWRQRDVYEVQAQVVCVLAGAWVIDFGVKAFQQSRPPRKIREGDWISASIYLGIDPFFYFEELAHVRGMPPLIYRWFIRNIRLQTAPFVETLDDRGRRILIRDESKSAYREIEQTDAWHDDDGHADYLLECELLDAQASRSRA